MNSFDVWDTLIGRRFFDDARRRHGLPVPGNEPQRVLQLELDQCFPILENVKKVAPSDLLLSDYDLPILEPIVRQITGLQNELKVTNDGKYNDWVWQGLPIAEHTGDSARSDGTCERHGIKFNHTVLTRFTQAEEEVNKHLPALALLMREARLTTWAPDPIERDFQLLQVQANLPFLFAASVLVHRRVLAGGFKRLLLASRDCWLWHQLFTALNLGGEYDVVYWLTSRLVRYFPSETYKRYLAGLLSVPALAVDLCGFGTSLRHAVGANSLELVGYGDCKVECVLRGWMDELSNFARHPMVADVNAEGRAVYANPLNITWEAVRPLAVMHEAFMRGVRLVSHYDFTKDINASSDALYAVLEGGLRRLCDYHVALGTMKDFRVSEAQATADLIKAAGPLPEGLIV
ncbi:Uncharacterised protein [uncultured archaeon]|nr:Uncharacterised protein [uncultured archaeon]